MEKKIIEKFLKKHDIENTEPNRELVEVLSYIDPSSNKKYLYWLFKSHIEEYGYLRNFDEEHWDNVHKALVVLDNYPDRFKNINQSTDIFSYVSTDELIITAEKARQKSNKKVILKDNIDLVDEFDGIVILYPSTAEASCFYGRGTRWCVTDEETYYDYMERGYLFYILNKVSNYDDYKTALFVNIFDVVNCYDSKDNLLSLSFEDVEEIEYYPTSDRIIYPLRVSKSISKYMKEKLNNDDDKIFGKVFKNWYKSLNKNYKASIVDIGQSIFELKEVKKNFYDEIGKFEVYDLQKLLNKLKDDFDFSGIFFSHQKVKNLVQKIGKDKIMEYINLDLLFERIMLDGTSFRFKSEYGVDDLIDDGQDIHVELKDLKNEFMDDPIKFYNDNVYVGTEQKPLRFTNYLDLPGILFYYDDVMDYKKFSKDYPAILIDDLCNPYKYIYNGKKYYIINVDENNQLIDTNGNS